LPARPHYEPDQLLNHALFTDALPGSTIKPIMALGFMHDAVYRKRIFAERVSVTSYNFVISRQAKLKFADLAELLPVLADFALLVKDRKGTATLRLTLYTWICYS